MVDTQHLSIDETLRRGFEAAWLSGAPLPIEEFLPPENEACYLGTLEELVHIELEFAWHGVDDPSRGGAGGSEFSRPARLEDYLVRFRQLDRPDAIKRLAQQEFRLRRARGESPKPDEYRQRFPGVPGIEEALPGFGPELGSASSGLDSIPGRVDRYYLKDKQGTGGFGVVWRATDPILGREVAIKQLHDRLIRDATFRRRFVNEARITAQLEHPGIVPIHELGAVESQRPFYTMKFVRGETLAEAIARFHARAHAVGNRAVEQRRLLSAFLAVCRAMEYAHDRGVIHRDLKPQNVVLGQYGETLILDWGLAKKTSDRDGSAPGAPGTAEEVAEGPLTEFGAVQGTPSYMAPEQAAGNTQHVDHRSDVYALGTILFQILTGRLPFEGYKSAELLARVIEQTPPRPRDLRSSVAPPLEGICCKAMAKQPDDRYQRVGDLSLDLEHFMADEPVAAYADNFVERMARFVRRRRTLVAGLVTALAVAAAGLASVTAVQRGANRKLTFANANLLRANQKERDALRSAVEQRREAERQATKAARMLDVAVQTVDEYLVEVASDDRLRYQGLETLRHQLLQDAEDFYAKLADQGGPE
ncbi:MAG TPA: serine/threonine-protein kinase, partial [Pirellulaceae bacterium]